MSHTEWEALNMINSEPQMQFDADIAAIQIGAIVVVGFVALIFVTLGDGSRGPDAETWRAAVTVVIVGCLIAGLINVIRAIAQSRRRSLANEAELCEPNVTMASWLALPSSADAGK
jgi:hypothetical protein